MTLRVPEFLRPRSPTRRIDWLRRTKTRDSYGVRRQSEASPALWLETDWRTTKQFGHPV